MMRWTVADPLEVNIGQLADTPALVHGACRVNCRELDGPADRVGERSAVADR